MATVTPNFNWPVPTSTDLVKDGATAIEALGDSIDASFVDLKGGTTGQVLAKASNTDLDYTWTDANPGDITGVTAGTGISGGGTSGTVTVTNSMATAIDAKGDLVPGTGADTFARLAVGANDTVLTADSSTATGLKWATPPASGGITLISTTTLSGSSISLSSIASTYKNLYVEITGAFCNTTYAGIFVRFNSDSGTNYDLGSQGSQNTSGDLTNDSQQSQWYIASNTDNTNAWEKMSGYFTLQNYAQTTVPVIMFGYSRVTQFTNKKSQVTNGQYRQSAAVSAISIHTSSGTFSGGTVRLYGVS